MLVYLTKFTLDFHCSPIMKSTTRQCQCSPRNKRANLNYVKNKMTPTIAACLPVYRILSNLQRSVLIRRSRKYRVKFQLRNNKLSNHSQHNRFPLPHSTSIRLTSHHITHTNYFMRDIIDSPNRSCHCGMRAAWLAHMNRRCVMRMCGVTGRTHGIMANKTKNCAWLLR